MCFRKGVSRKGSDDVNEGKSQIYFMNEDHNFVPKDEATICVINEYDADGNRIREVWGRIDKSRSDPEKNLENATRKINASLKEKYPDQETEENS
ncbi:MAG: hypothetical protein ABFC56_03810 [Clostridiaceae bacterium]